MFGEAMPEDMYEEYSSYLGKQGTSQNLQQVMARKSALEKIEYHEKICRLMQKQTFEQIQQLKNQIIRIERILIGTAAFVIISLLEKII
jgi:hypothetical protein